MNTINTKIAATSCICGLLSLGNIVFQPLALLALPGVICGHKALNQLKKQPDIIERRLALIGLLSSYLIIVPTIVMIILYGTGIIPYRS